MRADALRHGLFDVAFAPTLPLRYGLFDVVFACTLPLRVAINRLRSKQGCAAAEILFERRACESVGIRIVFARDPPE